MKVCSLYGAGFYYIPGTDTCIKIGGYVRAEYYHNENGAFPQSTVIGAFNRGTDTYGTRARGMISADVRTQTEYGTLRSYMRYGQQWTTNGNGTGGTVAPNFERAFIQFAGFTFGRTDSYFDFYNGAAYGLTPTGLESTVGPAGINVAAYTAQFGNGVSASISLEDGGQRNGGVYDLSTAVSGVTGQTGGTPFYGVFNAGIAGGVGAGIPASGAYGFVPTGTDQGGRSIPDIVANLRVDQAWGSAQIMGALHQIDGKYWGSNFAANGHAGNEWGWAVGAGLTLKMPWNSRDTFSMQAAYTEGAIKYAANGVGTVAVNKSGGMAFGPYSDAVYSSGNSLELTEAWSITAAFEHYWTPSLRTSVIGGYLDVSYNGNATAMIAAGCTGTGANNTSMGGGFGAFTNCSPDWKMWRVGSRTMWNPVANLDIGLEVFYTKVETAFAGNFATVNNGVAGLAAGTYEAKNQDFWTGAFRVQRNFWP